jgi:transcriptional regulator with XRE-family HTH domain
MTKLELCKIVGKNIRKERLANNMTIDTLAELLGLTPSYVGLIERGGRGTTALNLLRLSKIFCLPIDAFFEHDEPTTAEKTTHLHRKVNKLIEDCTEDELNFILHMVKGLREFNCSR